MISLPLGLAIGATEVSVIMPLIKVGSVIEGDQDASGDRTATLALLRGVDAVVASGLLAGGASRIH